MHSSVQMYHNDPVVVTGRRSIDVTDHLIIEIRQQVVSDSATIILPTEAWQQVVDRLVHLGITPSLVTQEG